jgi:hypothetical protein
VVHRQQQDVLRLVQSEQRGAHQRPRDQIERPARFLAREPQRLALALRLLQDEAFDSLLTGESAFESLPEVMPRLVSRELPALCHGVTYEPIDEPEELPCSA